MTGIDRLRRLARSQNMDNAWTAMLAHELCDIADQIEREITPQERRDEPADDHADDVSMSAYDLLPQEDREAITWVREHGGLDHVRAEWRSRVPYDLYERRRRRLLDHIAECETALGRRNVRIEKLGRRVGDLTRENAELRKRAMPEGCDEEFIKLHMSNLWGFMFDVMDRLGVDKSDSDAPEIVFDALDRRLMPEGMEWMLWDDGKPVTYDDAPDDVIGVYLALDGSGYVLMTDLPDQLMSESSDRVRRPAVPAADGEPLEAGQTVWDANGDELVVGAIEDGGHTVTCRYADVGDAIPVHGMWAPSDLTHQRPVLDADGVEIREKRDVWWICEGDERGVHAERLRVETICPNGLIECSPYNGGTWVYLEPSELYVNKPVLDADGRPLREGETVWDVETGDRYTVDRVFSGTTEPDFPGHTVACRRPDDIVTHMFKPSQLTHERPVMDADGVPIREDDTVWHIKTGREYVVVEPSYGETVVVRLAKYDDAEGEQYTPDQLTHTKPEVDTWQRIEDDATKNPFDYCKDVGHKLDTCENAERFKSSDLVRRAKKLAGVDND